jgi:hypothetical protein
VQEVADCVGFLRVLEVTPGSDELGHFHHHVWMHSSWLDVGDMHDAWRSCVMHVVERRFPELVASYDVPAYQVDLREADPATFDQELIKYLLKDWSEDKHGVRMSPANFGRILQALEGTRMRQGASGWKEIAESLRELPLCRDCGSTVVHDIRHVDRWKLHAHHEPAACQSTPSGVKIRPPPASILPRRGEQLVFRTSQS